MVCRQSESLGRKRIWRLHWPSEAPIQGQIDFAALAEHELTGREIKKAVLTAAVCVLNKLVPAGRIAQDHVEAAARSVVATKRVGFGR